MRMSITIAWLYPDLMSTYGDRGNVIVLQKRSEWRGIDATIVPITLESKVVRLMSCDLIFMGGAQDRQQKLVGVDFLKHKGPAVKEMVEKGIPALFVCAAYQFVGHYYKPYQGDKIPGAGIFDLYTEHPGDQAKRLISNVTAEVLMLNDECQMLNKKTIVGFENHGGRTYLNTNPKSQIPMTKPFARVKRGFGNNGEDGYEGAVYKNAIGSYFHGPFLPKNPHIADWLIAKALAVKYGKPLVLQALDDSLEWQAHNQMI